MPLTKQILVLSVGAAAVLGGSWLYNGWTPAATMAGAPSAQIIGEQSGPAGEIPDGTVAAEIRNVMGIQSAEALPGSEARAEPDPYPLRTAYAIRMFDPIWTRQGARELQTYVETAEERGIRIDSALIARVDQSVDSISSRDPAERGQADLLLSRVFLQLADHMRNGPLNDSPGLTQRIERVDPEPLHTELAYAGAGRFDYARLDPDHDEYDDLLAARMLYAEYAEAGGFTPMPEIDEALERGDVAPVIETLRLRLAEEGFETEPMGTNWISASFSRGKARSVPDVSEGSGDTEADDTPPEYRFDGDVENALIEFQEHNGLEPDGILGPNTIDALNVTAEQKLARIDANLERWRWAPPDLGETHVRVNIPAFRTEGYEDGRQTIEMRAIVGMRSRQTPVFADSIEHIVANPRWYVPESILVRDKLDDIRSDPSFITNGGYFVLDRQTGERVEPASVDWESVGVSDRYRLVQNPGSRNALGPVKIMFPNEFSVYLHGTPSQTLFEPAIRAYSSGCIRLERPEEMARWVARAGGIPEQISTMDEAWDTGSHVRIDLARPIPVHILYYTVEMDDEGDVVFHHDIYDRDDALIEALAQWELTLPDNSEI